MSLRQLVALETDQSQHVSGLAWCGSMRSIRGSSPAAVSKFAHSCAVETHLTVTALCLARMGEVAGFVRDVWDWSRFEEDCGAIFTLVGVAGALAEFEANQ